MSKNAFDDLLRKKMNESELPYQDDQWARLVDQLPSENKRDRKFLFGTIALGAAAAIALLLASVLLYRFINSSPANPDTPHGITASQTLPSQNPADESEKHPTHGSRQATASEIAKNAGSQSLRPFDATSGNPVARGTTAVLQNGLSAEEASFLNPSHSPLPEQTKRQSPSVVAKVPTDNQLNAAKNQSKTGMQPTPTTNDIPPVVPSPNVTTSQKTLIAVGAGMNYGSVNAGYSIGFTAKHTLGNNFFVEGTVALMYNNDLNNSGNYSGAPTTAARPSSFAAMNAGPTPTFTPTQSLYYVQFNPSFGYQVGDRLSLSVGGDIQQLISDNSQSQKVLMRPDGLRYFPELDLGITGKTDFKVAPHIHAGLIFREGLNNFLLSQSDKYVNRRYFEVQFKYSIPIH